MTTLELLNEIEKAPAFMGGSERYKSVAGSDILYKQDIEQIRKELEVLEILKTHLSIFNTSPQCMYPDLIILQGGEISLEEAKTIKEWLEK